MNNKLMPRASLIVILAFAFPAASFAFVSVGVSVGFAPPALPLYAQPPCPAPGYIWTPGYWAYSPAIADYYWVPGTWVVAPLPGLLWTPGYWAFGGEAYLWHPGYWGPHVGFYGGINYGYGYFGVGFEGGYWRNNNFYYNRAVTNISNVNITNVYSRTVLNTNYYGNRPSFNGGTGVHAIPTSSEILAAREPHRGFTEPQRLHADFARNLPALRASANHGYPSVPATARAGAFQDRAVVPAHYVALGASARPNPARAQAQRAAYIPRAAYSGGRYGIYAPPARHGVTQAPRQTLAQPQRRTLAARGAPPARPAVAQERHR